MNSKMLQMKSFLQNETIEEFFESHIFGLCRQTPYICTDLKQIEDNSEKQFDL